MNYQKKPLLIPKYIKSFRCIGPSCKSAPCCLAGMNVDIDRETYEKYKNCKGTKLEQMFQENIIKNNVSPSNSAYARIRRDKYVCPFFTKEGLCLIQSKLGESYLSKTCAQYPRKVNLVGGNIEISASLSCPEAARLALLNRDGIEFIKSEIDSKDLKRVDFDVVINGHNIHNILYDLRFFTIKLLKSRDYEIWERLIILGMLYNNVAGHYENGKYEKILSLIKSYTDNIVSGAFKDILEKIPAQTTIQMKILRKLTHERLKEGMTIREFVECVNECLAGIMYDHKHTEEEISKRYNEAYERYYNPFFREHQYILENYLVNYTFRSMPPVNRNINLYNAYVEMVLHYSLIKLYLIGMAAFHKAEFSIDLVIKLIWSFTINIELTPGFLQHIFNLLEKNEYTSMAYMAILVKN